jgi:hypothetical protein
MQPQTGDEDDNLEIWSCLRICARPDSERGFGLCFRSRQFDPVPGRCDGDGYVFFRPAVPLWVYRMGPLCALHRGGDPLGTTTASRLGLPLGAYPPASPGPACRAGLADSPNSAGLSLEEGSQERFRKIGASMAISTPDSATQSIRF